MKEIFDLSFSPAVLPATILLLFVSLYWLTVLLGFLDFKSLDIGKDISVDADVDAGTGLDADAAVHTDAHLHGDAHPHADLHGQDAEGPGGIKGMLLWFNLGDVPLMVFLSFLALFLWAAAVITAHFFSSWGTLPGILLLIPLFLVMAVVARFITLPLKALFRKMNQTSAPLEATGRICVITVQATPHGMGQARLLNVTGDITLNVRTRGNAVLNKGEQAIVLDKIENTEIYLIEPFNPE